MNILSKVAVSGLVLSLASVSTMASAANSISGSTDFRVTLPEILVLYHWDDAHLVLTDVAGVDSANNSDPREISDIRSHDLTAKLGSTTYSISDNPIDASADDTNNPYKKVSVTLQKSWAVRSLSSGTEVELALSIPNNNNILKNVIDSTSLITIDKTTAALSDGTNTAATLQIPSGWAVTSGDLTFDLDLSSATRSGEYNTRATAGAASVNDESTDTFLLTLTGSTAP